MRKYARNSDMNTSKQGRSFSKLMILLPNFISSSKAR
jgi:hypothetical protein